MTACGLIHRARAWLATAGTEALFPVRPDHLGAFFIGKARAGVLTPAVMAALREDPLLGTLVPETAPGVFTLDAAADADTLSLRLTALCDALEARGLTQKRRHENLDVFAEDGTVLARMERCGFRTLGLKTVAVRAHALTADGRLLLQKRSLRKQIGPGLWDNLAAGMVSAGESCDAALVRELAEEAGLTVVPDTLTPAPALGFVSNVPIPWGWMHEETVTARLTLSANFEPENRDGEAEAFAAFTLEEAMTLIERGALMPEAAAVICLDIAGGTA